MSIKRDRIEAIKRVNPTRIAEYQEQVLHDSARKIQSIWRGYKARSNQNGLQSASKVLDYVVDDLVDTPEVDNGRFESILDKIKLKSQKYDQLVYSKSQLAQKISILNELTTKKASRIDRDLNQLLSKNYEERTSYWLEACEKLDPAIECSRTAQDPVVDDLSRSMHKDSIKNGHGWWKEKLNKNVKWNEQDLEFEAWIAALETLPTIGGNRFF
jgi:IQ calmodulin-binding motif